MSLNSLQKCFQFNLKISLSITGSWVTYDFTKGAINGTGDYNTFGAPVVIRRFSSSPDFALLLLTLFCLYTRKPTSYGNLMVHREPVY